MHFIDLTESLWKVDRIGLGYYEFVSFIASTDPFFPDFNIVTTFYFSRLQRWRREVYDLRRLVLNTCSVEFSVPLVS